MNSGDIHPSESVSPIMVNVNSDQAASVTVPCFSSFIALSINFCDLDFILEKLKGNHLYAKCAVPL